MKLLRLLWFLAASFVLFVPSLVCAEEYPSAEVRYDSHRDYDRVGRVDIGVQGAKYQNELGPAEDSAWIGGSVDYGLTPWAAFGVSGGYASTENDRAEDIEVTEFMAEIILRFAGAKKAWNDYRLVPYVKFGTGGLYRSVDSRNGAEDETKLAWKVGTGIDYFINEHWALNLEAAYQASFTNLSVRPDNDRKNKLGFWTFGGGVKYIF